MEDYYEYLDSNGVTTLYKLIKDDTVALIDSYSVTINGITTTLDTHINDSDIHTPIADIENMVDTKIAGLVNSAPETLDTLKELADALGNDSNFATTVVNQIDNKADKDTVYTKLETDTLLEDKANSKHNHVVKDITDFPIIPTKVSDLTNDSGYITSVSWEDVTSKPELSQVAISGSYSDLSGTPIIPTKTSQLINDSGFLTSSSGLITSVSWSNVTDKPNFATVATSGSYNDLANKPTIPSVYNKTLTIQKNGTKVASFTSNSNTDVTANITVPTKVSELSNDSGFITGISWDKVTNKPTLATVATSGSYTDLSNTPTIPTKLSQLENDMEFGTGGDTSDCVHKTGDETINGTKTFSDKIISNKELHYKDTTYDWTDTSLNTWCNAGHVAWFDKTGNRRMHELVGANGGVWKKACYINEKQYFSVDSNRNVSFYATVSFNENVYAYNNIFHKNNNMDITTKPSSTLYSNYIFKDKNEKTLSYIQYAHSSNGTNSLGCFLQDSANKLYGVLVNTAKEFYPYGDNTYSLGKSKMRWANVYATTFNGNFKGTINSTTTATTQATSDNSTKIATTAWVRTYVNSVAGSGSVGASISAYYSNATTLTATGTSAIGTGLFPAVYSDYINMAPTVGTIYTGSQLFSSFTPNASGTISSHVYQTTAIATANFSGAFSPSAKYLCTTANAVRFRAYVSQGTNSSMGSPSVVDNSSTKSIFIRVE